MIEDFGGGIVVDGNDGPRVLDADDKVKRAAHATDEGDFGPADDAGLPDLPRALDTKSNIDYCQMYEPKPTFKVGDWVKYDIDTYLQVIEPSSYDDLMKMPKDRTLCRTLSGINVYPYTSLLTKASHSEVVVPITISGTVRPAYNEDGTIDDEQFQLLPNGSWDGTEMFISFDALDTHTRELVESLLKAQEEE